MLSNSIFFRAMISYHVFSCPLCLLYYIWPFQSYHTCLISDNLLSESYLIIPYRTLSHLIVPYHIWWYMIASFYILHTIFCHFSLQPLTSYSFFKHPFISYYIVFFQYIWLYLIMPDYILWSSFIALSVSISSTVKTVYLQLAHLILALKSGLVTQLASHWQWRVIDISLLTCLYTREAFGRWSASLGIFGRHFACAPICGAISVSETVTDLTLRQNSTRRIQITFVLAGNMYLHLSPSKAFAACVAFWGAHGDPNSMRGCCLEEHGQRVRSSSPYPVGDISFNLLDIFELMWTGSNLPSFPGFHLCKHFCDRTHIYIYIITIIIVIITFIIPLYK